MTSFLKWIWAAIVGVGKKLASLFEWIWAILSSLVTWIIAGITYVLKLLWDWISGLFDGVGDWFGDLAFERFPVVSNLASYWLGDVFQFDTAFDVLAGLAVVFVAAKLARAAMVPVRAVLELL